MKWRRGVSLAGFYTFGTLSKMYKILKADDAKKAVADYFGVSYSILESWMENLSYIRNICAHHGRLWNRTLTITAAIPNNPTYQWTTIPTSRPEKLYPSLCVIAYMLERCNKHSPFFGELRTLFYRFPKVDVQASGFPSNWRKDIFWKKLHIPFGHHLRVLWFKVKNLFKSKK